MAGAGDIINRVGVRMMVAMICNPCAGSSGSIENGKEDQNLFCHDVEPHRAMRTRPVISDRGSKSTEARRSQGCKKDFPTR
jgi:hypothetical protein